MAPDLALFLSVVTLFYCLILFQAPQKLFRDSDTGWHIVTGEKILTSMRLPRQDPYSFSRAGQPWVAWEWGSDCLMGAAYRLAGLSGVVWLFALAIAAVTWLWVQLSWAAAGNFLITCLLASPMLSTANLHWLARPHVFGWIFLVALIWYFEARESDFRFGPRQAALLFFGAALWANLHASFFLAPLIALLYAAGHLLRPLIWNLDARLEWKMMRWYVLAAACTVLGSLVNPYGWNLHFHVIRYLANAELLDRVGEFQTFNFHVEGAGQILLALAIAGLGGVLSLAEKKLPHFFLSVLLIGAALRSARALPLAALVLLPLANGAITDGLRRARDLRPTLRHALSNFLAYSDRLRLLDRGLSGVWLVPVFAALALLWLRVPAVAAATGFPRDQFPTIAAGELATLPPDARVLAPDKFGGYIIFRFAGARKVFFDGRSDFYGSDFLKQYIQLVEVRPGWQDMVRRFQFTHALLPRNYSLVSALQQAGWRVVFRDEVAILLENPAFALIQPPSTEHN